MSMAGAKLTLANLKAALPDTSRALSLEGAGGEIEIFRDAYGIPHVKASSYHDAFFGQGFATAQDRLWHMDHDRHVAYGRWAELAGESAVEQDVLMRRLGIGPSVEDDSPALNMGAKIMLDAYAAGVNAYMDGPDPLPVEYGLLETVPEPWQPWDCLAVFKVRHILMGRVEGKVWRARLIDALGLERAAQVIPGYQEGHLLITPPGEEYGGGDLDVLARLSEGAQDFGWLSNADGGSNNWALSGSRTASGKPLLAGDPHRALDTPNPYYQSHVACPEFDAIGLSFPGCPGYPHFGHNADVAWGVTHAGADYQDVYLERFKEDQPFLYEWNGDWREAEIRHEVVEVRGGRPVELDVTVTHHGPVIVGDPASGNGLSLRYTGTDGPNRWSQCMPRMLRATSADEIEESMRDWVDPCNNFVFADVQGDIGYLQRGRLPVRPELNRWLPAPGWTDEYDWRGFVPFEELVRARNPSTGYIVTANNRIAGDDYPHYIGLHYAPGYRAGRIRDRVEPLDSATVEDMASIHSERVSIPARTYADLLSRVRPLDGLSVEARRRLVGWDGAMDMDAVAPTIYSAFRLHLDGTLIRGHLGPLAEEALATAEPGAWMYVFQLKAQFESMARNNDTSALPPGADWESLAAQALAEGVAFLKELVGDDMDGWTWGSVHSTRHRHYLSESFPELADLLDPRPVSMGGDGDTPHAASYSVDVPFTVTSSSIARYVFDTADWDNSRWIIPLGASGHPGSPHYGDQTPVWADTKLVPMLYSWDRIAAEATSRQQLRRKD